MTFSQAMSNRLQLQPRLGMRHPHHITATPVSGKPSTTPVSTVIGTVASQVGDTRVSDWFRWPELHSSWDGGVEEDERVALRMSPSVCLFSGRSKTSKTDLFLEAT